MTDLKSLTAPNSLAPLLILLAVFVSAAAFADPPEIAGIEAFDTPNDAGHSIILSWERPVGEGDGGFYLIEARAEKDGAWRKLLRFASNKELLSDYPDVFGRPDNADSRHAVKIDIAPPPEKTVERLRLKAGVELDALMEKLAALEGKLEAYGVAYTDYESERVMLDGRIRALSGDSPPGTAKELYARRKALLAGDYHLNDLYEHGLVLKEELKRLSNWAPPETVRLETGHLYHFRLRAEGGGDFGPWAETEARPYGNYINTKLINNLAVAVFVAIMILIYIVKAMRNPEDIFVRRIPGLEAVEEAIGRATEMGKPIFFIHGLENLSHISTVAAINILGKIAEKVAEYGTEFKVTNRDPVVLAVSQETVKESYLRAGRPDLYNDDNVFYVSQDQFSYATGVEGMMLREKPASNFFFGYFFAESLLLAETGSHIGAIQIAGTDAYTQLPFFITTCDYTLIGEELYAASAYLSREPKLLASLKAQDLTKGLLIVLTTLGVLLSSSGFMWFVHLTESF